MIEFTFTEEQELLRQAAKEFAETKVAPHVAEMEKTGSVCPEIIKGLAEAQMMALTIPQDYEGLGMGYVARLIALEEISKVSVAVGMMLQVFGLGIEPIIKFGTEEQKRKYLPRLARGECLSGTAVTEPSGGSDPAGIKTTYVKDGESFILNGRKCFITNSHVANTMTVLAKNPEEQKAFSAFILEKGMEGFSATHEERKVGMRGCNTGELTFHNCRVPQSQLLGKEGKGLAVTMKAIGDVGRGGMAGCALGLHSACLESAIKFSNQRILYGKPLSQLPAIQSKLADMKIDFEAGKLLTYRSASMQDKGEPCSNEFAVAKYFTTEAAQKAAKMALDVHGGYGCMEEYAVSRYLRDAAVLGPSAGTSDIMKVIIARWILS